MPAYRIDILAPHSFPKYVRECRIIELAVTIFIVFQLCFCLDFQLLIQCIVRRFKNSMVCSIMLQHREGVGKHRETEKEREDGGRSRERRERERRESQMDRQRGRERKTDRHRKIR